MPRQPISHVRKVKFAHAVFAGLEQQAAARKAGFKNGPGLQAQASRLARDPEVVLELERLRSEHEAKAVASREEVLQVLTRHLRGDLSQLMTKDGKISLKKALKAGAIVGLESIGISKDGIRFKLHSVQGAAERLARLQGYDKPVKIELTRSVESMTEAELLAELAKLGVTNGGPGAAAGGKADAQRTGGVGAGHAGVPAGVRQPGGDPLPPGGVPGAEKVDRR